MFKNKSWFGWSSKPKNVHSLDHLKYLYNLMSKNQTVTEQNKTLLVETLRLIAEILIWGDQNDNTVFDFFLEKNMLSFFLKIMKQKCGSYVCVQLLQTLNILFENIRNETSLYYLLSNNHVNSIIVHKFDFSDEEVMAYYISFLKTLSLKLNAHTIHFFFNETTNDFPLYTEAIKFFNHNEKMVRIAVRTLTLNVFKVDEKSMLKFIGDRTAVPYFSNLVWFIGNHVIDIDTCLHENKNDQQALIRLDDLVAEHLDHLHYLNDILLLQIDDLNNILSDHLLNRLLIPLYIFSLIPSKDAQETSQYRPRISQVVSLFLLSQVFLIFSHKPLIQKLVDILLNSNMSIFDEPEFAPPEETLEESLIQATKSSRSSSEDDEARDKEKTSKKATSCDCKLENNSLPNDKRASLADVTVSSLTDEEKAAVTLINRTPPKSNFDGNRPFLKAIYDILSNDEQSDDHLILFSLCLLYAMLHNTGIPLENFECLLESKTSSSDNLSITLIDHLLEIMRKCSQYNSRIRLATLELCILLFKKLVYKDGKSTLSDHHLATLEQTKEEATLILRNFYKSEEEMLFLDMFEDEHQEMRKKQLNVEYLMMDANLLLPPSQLTPFLVNGVDFTRRLPCADVERTRYAIRVFFLLRQLSLCLRDEKELHLPLTNYESCVKVEQLLDLNNSDLIACTVISKDQAKTRRFMVIDFQQVILIEPDARRLGWGIAKFVAFLQDVEVNPDKDDSRSLHIVIRQNGANSYSKRVLLNAKFIFDDHIRCMAAKQRLTKGRIKARQRKMLLIAKLIELPTISELPTSRRSSSSTARDMPRSHSQTDNLSKRSHHHHGSSHKPLCRLPGPGSAVPTVSGSGTNESSNKHLKPALERRRSASSSRGNKSKEESPRANVDVGEEMILMEDLSPKQSRRRNRSHSENRDNADSNALSVASQDSEQV